VGSTLRWTACTRVAVAALLALLGWLGDARVALAQAVPVALYVEGPDAASVRALVLQALPSGIELADEKVFRAELVREGQNRPIGRDLDPAVIDRVRRAARVMGVGAVLVVRVRRVGTARRALLLVVHAWKTPASAEEAVLTSSSRDGDVAAITSALGQSLEPYAQQPARVAEAPPAPSGPPEAPESPPSSAPSAPAHLEPLPAPSSETPALAERVIRPARTNGRLAVTGAVDIALTGAVVGRRFEYKNGIQPHVSRYTLSPAPAAGVRGQLFPLAHAGAPWGDVGFIGEYTRIFSPLNDTSGAAADAFPSSYSAGLRARIHPGSDPRLVVGASVEYAFTSRRAVGPAAAQLPDVTYRAVRPALDTRIYFGPFSLLQEVAFRAVVDRDAISTRFYAPQGFGLDAELGGALMLDRTIEARLAEDYELYSFVFEPPAGATFEAGSARDQLYGAELAVAFVL
jgi:hypothetical protein